MAGALAAAVFLFAFGNGLQAQDANAAGQLVTEINQLEQRLASAMPPAERHGALVRLARLRQLSGNIAVAADLWLEAAALNPADDSALVAGAYSLAAIGEWERAFAVIQPLLDSGRRGPFVLQARYLDATLRAWTASDISALLTLAEDPEAAALRPMIYYTLWWTETRDPISFGGNAEFWRQRLLTEYPRSPEARIVIPEAAGTVPSIGAIHSPMWLLLPGVPDAPPAIAGENVPQVPVPQAVVPQTVVPQTVIPQTVVPQQQPSPRYGRQTGLFRNENNARNHAEALRRSGFSPLVTRRLLNGVEHWAVVVPIVGDPNRTASDLRRAGHDSFTVRLD